MSGLTDTLTNLPIPDEDDFNLAPPETYVMGGIEMLPAGLYDLQILDFTVNTDDEKRPGHATSVDVEMTVVGAADAKYLGRFTGRIRLFTKKFERKPGIFASSFGDFIMAINDTERWAGQDAGIDWLAKAKDRAIPVQLKLDWEAYDKKGFEAEGGLLMTPKSDELKALRRRVTVKGMKNFPAYDDGTYRSTVEGPVSHEELQARLVIREVVPQSKRKTLAARA